MLSAIASSSSCAVSTQQEKSRPVLRITERPVRISVFDMLRTIAVKRLESIARSIGSNGAGVCGAELASERMRFLPGGDRGLRRAAGDHDRPARRALRARAGVEHDGRSGKLEDRRAGDRADVGRADHRDGLPAGAGHVHGALARDLRLEPRVEPQLARGS